MFRPQIAKASRTTPAMKLSVATHLYKQHGVSIANDPTDHSQRDYWSLMGEQGFVD